MMGWMAPLRHLGAKVLVGRGPPANREPSMNEITTVGLDLAKHVFQVHAACRPQTHPATDPRFSCCSSGVIRLGHVQSRSSLPCFLSRKGLHK